MKRNIFYISNTQSDYFPKNSRTKFDQYIDVNNLDYIKNDNIDVGVKSISFDTRQYVDIQLNIKQPHLIIIQNLNRPNENTLTNFKECKGLVGEEKFLKDEKNIEELIDIRKPKDYIICNTFYTSTGIEEINYFIEQRFNRRNFSNIIFVDGNTIIHHIYIHNTQFYFLDAFIKTINSTIKDLSFYHDNVIIEKNFIQSFVAIKHNGSETRRKIIPLPFTIHIHNNIATILGLYTGNKAASKLLHYFQDEKYGEKFEFPRKPFPANFFMNDVYLEEQNLNYFKIDAEDEVLRTTPSLFQSSIYEIRSNISDYSINNAQFDRVIGVFQDYGKQDVQNIEFQNPFFFKTTKEKLSHAKFDINGLFLNGQNKSAIGSPTYIQLVVKNSPIEMKRPFTIFLNSSCPISKKIHPQNKNTDFIIELPERLKFRMNWTVTLKTLFLSNKIHNIEDCFIQYENIKEDWTVVTRKKFIMKNGHYNTLSTIIHQITDGFRKNRMPFLIEEVNNGRVKITHTRKVRKGYKINFIISKYLASILGYTSSPKDIQFLRFDQNSSYIAPHNPNLFLTYPRNLIVGCNIVEHTMFGGEPFKLLRLITNSHDIRSDILSFEFKQDEKVALKVREFKSIHISILDATGSPVKSESDFPTRLQLMFSLE